jgi:hypothetical protein
MAILTHETLLINLKQALEREADTIVRQLMARNQSMTTVGFADFELAMREALMDLAKQHAKTHRG